MTSEFRLQRYYHTQTTPPYKIWKITEIKIIFRGKQSLLSLNAMQSYITNLIPAEFFRPNRAFDCAHTAYDVNDRVIKRALDSKLLGSLKYAYNPPNLPLFTHFWGIIMMNPN